MLLITLKDIQNEFDVEYYNHGLRLFKSGNVDPINDIEQVDSSVTFNSGVSSNNRYYRQIVEFTGQDDGTVKIDGGCTCSKGYYCEHLAAACFKYFENSKSSPEYLAEDWLGSIDKIKPVVNTDSDREDFIVYRLFLNGFDSDEQELSFFRSKYLQNGKVSKGKQVRYSEIFTSYTEPMCTSDLRLLLTELDCSIVEAYQRFYHQFHLNSDDKKYTISGALGYTLFELLCKSNKLFLGDSKDPLRFSDHPYVPVFSWDEKMPGYHNLISGSGDGFKLLYTKPELVLDVKQNVLSRLPAGITEDILNHLTNTPLFPTAALSKAFSNINKELPVYVPAPIGLENITNVDEKLKPIVKVEKLDASSDRKCLRLSFEYAGFSISPCPANPGFVVFRDAETFDVKRDLKDELIAVNKLESFGFISNYSNESYLCLNDTGEQLSQTNLLLWKQFLSEGIAELDELGWTVDVGADLGLEFAPASDISVECVKDNDWFSLSFVFEVSGEKRSLVPLVSEIINKLDSGNVLPDELIVELEPGLYLPITVKDYMPVVNTIIELYDYKQDDDTLLVGSYGAHQLSGIDRHVTWKGDEELLDIATRLKQFTKVEDIKPAFAWLLPPREYQKEGINWINFLNSFGFGGGVLADDMGLGKTCQILLSLARFKEMDSLSGPSLVVVPTSLLNNWMDEVEKFTNNLNAVIFYGPKRQKLFDAISEYDLIFTTYKLLLTDLEKHQSINYDYVILDEAQNIKNHKTAMAKAACSLSANNRIAMSGTPVENNLSELWSLFNFIMPGFLGSYKGFKEFFQDPIEKLEDEQRSQLLNSRIKPFILRRLKSEVLKELPPKTEIVRYVEFNKKQAELYESIRIATEEKIASAVAEKGLAQSQVYLFDALLKLRQACCHPNLLALSAADLVKESVKLDELLDMLSTLVPEGRKVLVFSSFTSLLDIVAKSLDENNFNYAMLTGSSTNRGAIVESFKREKDIFLISLKAGGTGLNLTDADTVIFFEPWWNPAAEDQAADRAFRMGQEKPVFVYRLIVRNSIEINILKLQKKKKQLQESVYAGGTIKDSSGLSNSEMLDLLDIKV